VAVPIQATKRVDVLVPPRRTLVGEESGEKQGQDRA
jgi:hypothetical protein